MGVTHISRLRYRASVMALGAALALTVSACGGSASTPASSTPASSTPASSTPASSTGTSSSSAATSATESSAATSATAAGSTASESEGQRVFVSAGCGGCHTLAAAHSNGAVGPNLDQLKPSYAAVVSQVTHGGGEMPSFSGKLSTAQIQAVAKFVAAATR